MARKMIICKTRKWGNSLGIIIPKHVVDTLHLTEDQEVAIDVEPKQNALQELFGWGKGKTKKTARQIVDENRKEMMVD